VWADDPTVVTINFGTADGYWAAHTNDAEHSTYTDSGSREWSRTFSANNTSSGQAGYSQFGNASNTCESLVFTATAGTNMTVTAFSVTMAGASGGKSPTTGTIYLYKRTALGTETQLATAAVSGTGNVTCSITSNQTFSSTDILKVSYEGTAKAIRISSLSYTYIAGGDPIPSVSLATYTINAPNTAVSTTSINVTYENLTDYASEVIFYESDGETEATYDHSWITAEINATTHNLDYSITANTGAARKAYLKVYAVDNDGEAYSSLVTITQAKAIVYYTYNLANAVIPGRHYIIASGTTGTVKAMGDQNGNYRDEVEVSATDESITISNDAGVHEIFIQANEAKGYYTLLDVENNNQYLYASSNSSNNINIEAALDKNDNGIWSIAIDENGVATIIAKGTNSRNWIRYNSSSARFSCYGASNTQADVYLFEKAGDTGNQEVNVTIAEACTDGEKYYATYSSPFGFVIPEGLTVEEIGISDSKLDVEAYAAGARVPANTGVLISSSTAGSKTLTLAGGGTSVKGENNRLRATGTSITAENMSDADAGCLFYRLTMHNPDTDNKIGFWWGAEDGAAFSIAANKAYLAVPEALASLARSFWFDEGETTSLNEVRGLKSEVRGEYFNLNGQRVAQPSKGLYIVNGRKVVIK
jgi:hypothetical protein